MSGKFLYLDCAILYIEFHNLRVRFNGARSVQ